MNMFELKLCNFVQFAKLDSSMINDFTLSLFSVILCRQGLIIFEIKELCFYYVSDLFDIGRIEFADVW